MVKKGINSAVKGLVSGFYLEGNILDNPIKRYIQVKLPLQKILLCKKIVFLLMKTKGFISEETKCYLSDYYHTASDVYRIFNTSGEIDKTKIKNKISYDMGKIVRNIGDLEFFQKLIIYNNNNMPDTTKFNKAFAKYHESDFNLNDNVLVDIPIKDYSTELSEEDFSEMAKTLHPYMKSMVDISIGSLSDSQIGYFMYLKDNYFLLEDTDKERYNFLYRLATGNSTRDDVRKYINKWSRW